MNKRPRDSQRQKVYDAGWSVDQGEQFIHMRDLRAYVYKIYRSRWRKALYRKYNLDDRGFHLYVGDGRSRRKACMQNGWKRHYEIKFPRSMRSQLTILHEIAHVLVEEIFTIGRGEKVAYHGREFCAFLFLLVRRWMGADAAKQLKAAYKKYRVKHTLPHMPKVTRCPRCGFIIQ